MKSVKLILGTFLLITALFWGCKKDEKVSQGKMQVRLTDAPANYAHVFVDIVGIEAHGLGGWYTVPCNPGLYDLLELQNGLDTVLAPPCLVPVGLVSQMRIKLGLNNYVVDTAGVVIPLKTPSGQTSGIKINIHETIAPGSFCDILLDFDASESIVVQGDGDLLLKPVIRKL